MSDKDRMFLVNSHPSNIHDLIRLEASKANFVQKAIKPVKILGNKHKDMTSSIDIAFSKKQNGNNLTQNLALDQSKTWKQKIMKNGIKNDAIIKNNLRDSKSLNRDITKKDKAKSKSSKQTSKPKKLEIDSKPNLELIEQNKEINERFLHSNINKNYVFPKNFMKENIDDYNQKSEDLDTSLQSLIGITTYDLYCQNNVTNHIQKGEEKDVENLLGQLQNKISSKPDIESLFRNKKTHTHKLFKQLLTNLSSNEIQKNLKSSPKYPFSDRINKSLSNSVRNIFKQKMIKIVGF